MIEASPDSAASDLLVALLIRNVMHIFPFLSYYSFKFFLSIVLCRDTLGRDHKIDFNRMLSNIQSYYFRAVFIYDE